ncbi:MAG: hypothetical protein WC444_03560 [Candidatus Paceibacterota bacterium]
MKLLKNILLAVMAIALVSLLAACGEQKFTTDEVLRVSESAATRAAADAKALEASKADAKWVRARSELRQMGAVTAVTGKFLITDNCKVKPDGFTQLQANKDFPSTAFTEFNAGCTSKVYAMKAERDKAKNRNVPAERRTVAKKAAAKQHVAQANLRR